jgi:hypothetical protein
MANENPKGREEREPASTTEEDRRAERAVLALLIHEHPAQLTMDELILVLHADQDQIDPGDAALRAVRELVGAGLLYRHGRFLVPSRAALHFAALEVD